MTALSMIRQNRLPHCNIRVAFTPDEEIGLGMDFFPIDKFPCDWAYTVDGGESGELNMKISMPRVPKLQFMAIICIPAVLKII